MNRFTLGSIGFFALMHLASVSAVEHTGSKYKYTPDTESWGLMTKPLRYATVKPIAGVSMTSGVPSKEAGAWRVLDDGTLLWQYTVKSPNAVSLDFGFSHFSLPESATLVVRATADGQSVGPFSAKDFGKSGYFYSPVLSGNEAVIEVRVPKADVAKVHFTLEDVAEGFLDVFQRVPAPAPKAGSCNLDVACPAGQAVSPQSRGVALYTFRSDGSASVCTGALIASATPESEPPRPYFLTANHCVSTAAETASMVLYWGYQSGTCRERNSTASGMQVARNSRNYLANQTGGANLLATYAPSDFSLVQLNAEIPDAANPFWLGWDRRDQIAHGAFIIHHPQGHEKRITVTHRDLTIRGRSGAGTTHLSVPGYALGTTEPGSSGAPLMSDAGKIIGQLTGGPAACSNNQGDVYGRIAASWTGGGAPESRLSDWLDPQGLGFETYLGMDRSRQREGGWFGIHGRVVSFDAECNVAIPDDPAQVAECVIPVSEEGGTAEVNMHIYGSGLSANNLVATLESPQGRVYEAPPAAFGVVVAGTSAMFIARFNRVEQNQGNWILRVHGRDPVSGGANGTLTNTRLFPSLGASYWAWSVVFE